jgi:hypothetical protein
MKRVWVLAAALVFAAAVDLGTPEGLRAQAASTPGPAPQLLNQIIE